MNKIIIEFNGDYWHANPDIYESTEAIRYPNKQVHLAKDIWEFDNIKLNAARNRSFDIIIVWETDYKKDKKKCIQKIKELYENKINKKNT
jgi:G:T-mismatch repair DNA endonuclease (very short patch repair protein)